MHTHAHTQPTLTPPPRREGIPLSDEGEPTLTLPRQGVSAPSQTSPREKERVCPPTHTHFHILPPPTQPPPHTPSPGQWHTHPQHHPCPLPLSPSQPTQGTGTQRTTWGCSPSPADNPAAPAQPRCWRAGGLPRAKARGRGAVSAWGARTLRGVGTRALLSSSLAGVAGCDRDLLLLLPLPPSHGV